MQELAKTEFVNRIGWTLLHSTWQILAFAALVGLALAASARRSAALRYNIACLGLLTMLLSTIATFALVAAPTPVEWADNDATDPSTDRNPATGGVRTDFPVVGVEKSASPRPTGSNLSSANPNTRIVTKTSRSATPVGPHRAATGYSLWIPWCVGVWIVGICLLSLWNIGGWLLVQRLRKRATNTPTPEAERRFQFLMQQMRISRPVRLLESLLVDVPVVVGWLRPVVLFPVSLVTSLTAAELDAVIAHELAHIRRHDYLVNLLQTFVETLLFFHPAVWWLSRRIRIEREFCCDDDAIAVCEHRTVYAKALAAVERNRTTPAYAISFLGADKNMTLNRVKRILDSSNTTRQGWLAGVATLLLLALTVSGVVYSQSRRSETPKSSSSSKDGSKSAVRPATESEKSAEQSAREQFDPRNLRLELTHHGASDKPFYRMTLSVAPQPDDRVPHSLAVRISEAKARAIIDHLFQSGFFRHARRPAELNPGSGSRYELRIQSGRQILVENLGWDLSLLQRLDSLKQVLDGQAEKALATLLSRMTGYRTLWTAGKAAGGIQTSLTTTNTIYRPGQPIPIRFTAANVGNENQSLTNPRVDITGLTVTDEDGRKLENLVGPVQLAVRRVTLRPGQSQVLSAYDLTSQYYLRRPGRYYVQYAGGILPASNRLLVIVKPDTAGFSDGDPLGRLRRIVPRDWLLISRPAADGNVQPGNNRMPTPGLQVLFYHNPGTSKRDIVLIWVWLTEKPAAAKKPPQNARPYPPTSEYLGKIAKWHVYAHLPAEALKRWPNARQEITRALAVERKLRTDSATEQARRIDRLRNLHERYKTLVLPAVQAGNKTEVERLTDEFNKKLSGNLLFVQLVTRDGPPTLHKTMISKFYGSRRVTIGKLRFRYKQKPIVVLSAWQDGYSIVATNPLEVGKWPDDIQITMAIADRKSYGKYKTKQKKTKEEKPEEPEPRISSGGGLSIRLTPALRTLLTKLTFELLESCTYESTDQAANERELARPVKQPHLRILFPKPKSTAVRAKGVGPTVRRNLAVSELVIPVSETRTPNFIFAKVGKNLRAYSKYHHKPIAALQKAVAVAAAPTWGKPAGNVRIRLRPARSQWKAGETPLLHLDIRNDGSANVGFIPHLAFCEIIVNGIRFHTSDAGSYNGPASVLAGNEIRRSALTIPLSTTDKTRWTSRNWSAPLRLAAGTHSIQAELRNGVHTWVSLPVQVVIR